MCRGTLVCVESIDPYLELTAPRRPAAGISPRTRRMVGGEQRWTRLDGHHGGLRVVKVFPRWLAGYGPGGPPDSTIPRLNSLAARQPTQRGFLVAA